MSDLTITELIDGYPEVDVTTIDMSVLIEIADRWLRAEHSRRRRATARLFERDNQQVDIIDAALSNAMNRIAREAAERIVNEWAPSLLAQSFALPDGRLVRWADATVDDHETRAAQLEKHSSGIIQTAALHRRAANDIRAAQGHSLSDVTRVSAVA